MPLQRVRQIALIGGLLWASWLSMMLVHEAGHVVGALISRGHVERVVWHPLALSRTDVQPNPSPLVVVWGGPLFGCVLPLLLLLVVESLRSRIAYLLEFFAGFCLIANGLYIGIGVFDPVGDAHDMLRLGTSRWVLAAFGTVAATCGLGLWKRASPRLGFGTMRVLIPASDAYAVVAIALLLSCIGFAIGNRGT
jgi:hypothetical protein